MSVKPLPEGYVVLGDLVIVKLDDVETVLDSGLILPDSVEKDEAVTGWVVGVGPGRLIEDGPNAGGYITLPVQVGDHIYHSKYGCVPIKVGQEEYVKMDRKALFMKMPLAPEEQLTNED